MSRLTSKEKCDEKVLHSSLSQAGEAEWPNRPHHESHCGDEASDRLFVCLLPRVLLAVGWDL